MRLLLPLLVALSSAPAVAAAPGVERCPALPADSGFEWQYKPAIDFYLCQAKSTSGGREFFGMYLGFAANFQPEGGVPRERGAVGGYDVVWYAQPKDATFKYVRQTLFEMPRTSDGYPRQVQVHVWVYAVTGDQLARLKQVLAKVRFNGAF